MVQKERAHNGLRSSRLASAKRELESMAAPPLVFNFIGVVFTAILYGEYYL